MKCFWCKKDLPSNLLALDLHVQLEHQNENISFFTCREGCNRAYGSIDSLKWHYRNSHGIAVYPHGKKISSRYTVQATAVPQFAPAAPHEEKMETDSPSEANNEHFDEAVLQPFKKCVVALLAKLSGDKSLPRSYVQQFVADVSTLLKCTSIVGSRVMVVLESCGAGLTDIQEVQELFEFLQNPFQGLHTEYRRLKYFKATEAYIPPEPYEIKITENSRRSKGEVNSKLGPVYGQHVSLPKSLIKFFELPDAFSSTIDYFNALVNSEDDYIYNYIQCPAFKAKAAKYLNAGEIVFPLFLFFDDLELNKDLGHHSKKIGAFYAKIASMVPECQSALSNIFLCLLFLSKYRTSDCETQKKIIKPLINDLLLLQNEGILVNIPNYGQKRIYFVTGLILGDNAGLNSLGGFVTSFSTANFMCRRCKVHKLVLHFQCAEDVTLLRTEKNFLTDVAVRNKSLTGVKDDSALRKITALVFPEDISVDPFHDFEEGICHNIMLAVVNKLIPKCFTMKTLNDRIKVFDYGPYVTNKVPPISEDIHLKDKFKMSGSEMTCFMRLFSLIVGDLVPENDPYWMIYLKLREVLDIVKAKAVPNNIGVTLNTLVSELNSMYCSVTGNSLTFKGHMIVHYGSFIQQNGPVDHVSTIRFEAKHRDITKPSRVNMSRTDICYSSAVKHQLAFAYKILSAESILPSTKTGSLDLVNIYDIDVLNNITHLIPPDFLIDDECFSCDWIDLKGTKYVHGSVLFVDILENSKPVFGSLEGILVDSNDKGSVLFVFSYFVNNGYNSHLHAYHVTSRNPLKYSIVKPGNLFDPMPLYCHKMANGDLYVPLKCMY